jgi:hypothetical protein
VTVTAFAGTAVSTFAAGGGASRQSGASASFSASDIPLSGPSALRVDYAAIGPADVKRGDRRAGIVLCHCYMGVRSI